MTLDGWIDRKKDWSDFRGKDGWTHGQLDRHMDTETDDDGTEGCRFIINTSKVNNSSICVDFISNSAS